MFSTKKHKRFTALSEPFTRVYKATNSDELWEAMAPELLDPANSGTLGEALGVPDLSQYWRIERLCYDWSIGGGIIGDIHGVANLNMRYDRRKGVTIVTIRPVNEAIKDVLFYAGEAYGIATVECLADFFDCVDVVEATELAYIRRDVFNIALSKLSEIIEFKAKYAPETLTPAHTEAAAYLRAHGARV